MKRRSMKDASRSRSKSKYDVDSPWKDSKRPGVDHWCKNHLTRLERREAKEDIRADR